MRINFMGRFLFVNFLLFSMKKIFSILFVFLALGCTQQKEFSEAYVPDYCSFAYEQNLPLFYDGIQAVQEWYDCNSTVQEISQDFQDNMAGWTLSSKVISEHLSSVVFYKEFDDYYELLTVSVIPNGIGRRIKLTHAFSEAVPATAWT